MWSDIPRQEADVNKTMISEGKVQSGPCCNCGFEWRLHQHSCINEPGAVRLYLEKHPGTCAQTKLSKVGFDASKTTGGRLSAPSEG